MLILAISSRLIENAECKNCIKIRYPIMKW